MAQGRLPVMHPVSAPFHVKGRGWRYSAAPRGWEQEILVEGYMTIARSLYVERMTRGETDSCFRASAVTSLSGLAAAPHYVVNTYSRLPEEPPFRAYPPKRTHRTGRPPAHRSFSFYVKAYADRCDARGRNARCRYGWKQT